MKRVITWLIIAVVLAGGYFGATKWLESYEDLKIEAIENNPDWISEQQRAEAMVAKYQRLQKAIDDFSAARDIGVYASVIDLRDNVAARHDEDETVIAASLYKLFVAYGIYQQVENGELNLGSATNAGMTIGECLDAMITVSNNECGKALGDVLTWSEFDQQLAAEGYTSTALDNYTASGALDGDKMTSAEDVALLLERLYRGELLNEQYTDAFADLLKDQEQDLWFSDDILINTVVGHKHGDLDGYIHDAGIFYGPAGDYVVVLMTGPWRSPYEDSPPAFHEFATSISTALTQ